MPPRVSQKSLRSGFSTGTAAAAAVQAALLALAERPAPATVAVPLPAGGSIAVPVAFQGLRGPMAEAQVIKDGGDDPDVTHGALIGAQVQILNGSSPAGQIIIQRGPGVGLVTRPGLPVPPGEPAINPIPRKMLRQVINQCWPDLFPSRPLRLAVTIYVPEGEELARQTLNPRLGILGGISILGTTGLVKPFSHQAYRATIALALKVARAADLQQVILSTGGKSEALAHAFTPSLPAVGLVQMGDFVRFAVRLAGRLGFRHLTIAAFFGKAMKMAQGLAQTHASQGEVDLRLLARWTQELTGSAALATAVAQANTAREAQDLLLAAKADPVVARVGSEMLNMLSRFPDRPVTIEALMFATDGQLLWRGLTQVAGTQLPGQD
ncbi:MAG: cobalt-precorrin-5B (C(1))-methyltransferase [Desulfobacca sp.]|uniref:cobalt-precorrin-5B (C(1))-methyltransferase n=1 Tax=Desulfobacca sp. TaxID=2067990 RepID=UPI00404AE78B